MLVAILTGEDRTGQDISSFYLIIYFTTVEDLMSSILCILSPVFCLISSVLLSILYRRREPLETLTTIKGQKNRKIGVLAPEPFSILIFDNQPINQPSSINLFISSFIFMAIFFMPSLLCCTV